MPGFKNPNFQIYQERKYSNGNDDVLNSMQKDSAQTDHPELRKRPISLRKFKFLLLGQFHTFHKYIQNYYIRILMADNPLGHVKF